MSLEFDILSDVLDSLRICGNLLLYESYIAPWAIALPSTDQLGQLLGVRPGTQAVAFHLVERGHIEVRSEASPAEPPLIVEAGEMVIFFSGMAHQISQGVTKSTLQVERVLAGDEIPFRCPTGGRGVSVACVCGIFYLHDTYLNPLFASLPPVLHAPISQAETFQNLSGIASLIVQELEHRSPGSDFMVERLLELLCAGAVRAYMEKVQSQEASWLTGLRDPIVRRSLALIHAQPGYAWSVDALAQHVSLSPSRFSARFKATLGESPMGYVTKWRLHIASRLLHSTEKNISEIAIEVGYENLAAFNRAFKRHFDVPPGAWRLAQSTAQHSKSR